MKTRIPLLVFFVLLLVMNTTGQTKQIESVVVDNFKEVSCTCDLIGAFNHMKLQICEDVDEKEFKLFVKMCQDVNKKNIPLYEIRLKDEQLEFYFKKGRMIYAFTVIKKGDLYLSNAKYYTFKGRHVKKEGLMAFKM